MITFIRFLLFGLSTLGFWELLRHHTSFHMRFYPVLTIAVQSCSLLMAGILNILPETTYLLWGLGIAGFLRYTFHEKGDNLKYYFRIEVLFLFVVMLVLFFCVRDKLFTHFDNFSHWALVVKSMLRTNRFPNFESLISFRSYPLGSSVFIFYTAKLIGQTEPIQMLGQAYMIVACILPLFPCEGRRRWISFFLLLIVANFFLSYNIQPTELLVDTLLPLAGMGALMFAGSSQKTSRQDSLFMTLFLIWIIQIKTAGIFYGAVAGAMYLHRAKQNRKLWDGMASMGISLFSLFLWNRHYQYVFRSSLVSQHSLSLSWWESALKSKSAEDVKHIAIEIVKRAFLWENFGFWMILLAGVLLVNLLFSGSRKSSLGKDLLFIVSLYLIYQAGLFLMYVFSMSRTEAFFLVCFDRYEKSIHLAVIYLIVYLLIQVLSDERPIFLQMAPSMLFSFMLCFFLSQYGDTSCVMEYRPYHFSKYDGFEVRNWVEKAKEEYRIPDQTGNAFYAFLIEDWDSDLFYFLGNYVFYGTDIITLEDATEEQLDQMDVQYLLIHDQENADIQRWVQKNYPEQAGNTVVQLW